ncbi:hypothetical protein M9H77_34227 [Catharanthus roseus]|uniref:Uncharacterized protein n=1 Tax=Catharanthus roseus TaxID=4058 RepID=A0ACB9ZMQ4_CATRO|nr:hypothetical protein M9H77_34227 [Catharanthus roseus]
MIRLQDLRRSSCNRLSSSGRVMCRLVISYDFSENKTFAQKIYNVVVKIKKNRMQGRNTVEEVLCLSAQRGYTVFYGNREESNVLSDIVVAYPTSIAMIIMWSCIMIIDTTYKTNKHIDHNVLAKLTEMVKDEEVAQRIWTSQVLHFGVETTNRAESEHSVLKLWLSMYHEIGVDIPDLHERDMDSEIRDLTSMLEKISTGPISKVREVRHFIKGVICPVLPEDPCHLLTNHQKPQLRRDDGR